MYTEVSECDVTVQWDYILPMLKLTNDGPSAVATTIAIFCSATCTQAMQFLFFIKPRGQICIILPISSATISFFLPHYSRIILDSLAHLLFSKLFPNN